MSYYSSKVVHLHGATVRELSEQIHSVMRRMLIVMVISNAIAVLIGAVIVSLVLWIA